ncbi:MAG TPA: ABC transporter permease subunit [Planctomycetota bacterium]|nr:ABC transporter permease subunit [Planctomycetota bacterium]
MAESERQPGAWTALFRFEWTKMAGRRITWVPFIVVLLVATIIVVAVHNSEFKFPRMAFEREGKHFGNKSEFVNGYFVASGTLWAMFEMLLPIFISVASGLMVAGEVEQGTLRACLIRPVSRARLILSKFAMLWVYAMLISLFAVSTLTLLDVANFGRGTVYLMNGQFHNGEGYSTITVDEAPIRLAWAWLLGSLGMTVLASLALLISSLVETAAMSYVVTLSVYFAFMILRQFPFLEWMYPYLFVTHMLRWQQVFFSEIKWGDIYVSVIHEFAYIVTFLSAAVMLFKERDIKS